MYNVLRHVSLLINLTGSGFRRGGGEGGGKHSNHNFGPKVAVARGGEYSYLVKKRYTIRLLNVSFSLYASCLGFICSGSRGVRHGGGVIYFHTHLIRLMVCAC